MTDGAEIVETVSQERETGREWWVFADATLAGLAALIPLPGLDLLVEGVFRRRIARTIAANRGAEVPVWVIARLGRGQEWLTVRSCLLLPVVAALWLVKRLFRKLVYVLTVAEAASQISAYWHRAWLVDHLVRSGALGPGRDVERALQLFREVLDEADTSPVRGLARQVARSPARVLRLVRKLSRGEGMTREEAGALMAGWAVVHGSLDEVVARFEELAEGPPGSAVAPP